MAEIGIMPLNIDEYAFVIAIRRPERMDAVLYITVRIV